MKFIRKRWHGIPVALVSALLVLTLVTGSALAWYEVTSGTANVTVVEAITIANAAGDGGQEFTGNAGAGYNWTVSMYPGEMKVLNILVSNASSVPLDVVAWTTNVPAGLTVTGNAGIALNIPVTIPGGTSGVFAIEVHADGDVAPGACSIGFTLNRQSP